MGNYVGKMVLVSGLEVGFGMAVWQTFTGFNWWVGRRFYAWGRLWLAEVVGVQVGNNNGSIYS